MMEVIVAAAALGVASEFIVPQVSAFVKSYLPASVQPSVRTASAGFNLGGLYSVAISGTLLALTLYGLGKIGFGGKDVAAVAGGKL